MVERRVRIAEIAGSSPAGSTMDTKQIGILGEKIAEKYLKDKGYQILDRNYSTNFKSGPLRGEIDIVAKKENILSFIEVKTLAGVQAAFFRPEEKVNFLKQRKIVKAAQSWLMKKRIPLDSKWQIDIVAIKIDSENKKARLRHFKNAVF